MSRKGFHAPRPPLHAAILSSDLERARRAIEGGALLDARDADGMTPLLWAVFRGDKGAVKLLLEAGADPTVRSGAGETPLWHAEEDFGLEEIAGLLRRAARTRGRSRARAGSKGKAAAAATREKATRRPAKKPAARGAVSRRRR